MGAGDGAEIAGLVHGDEHPQIVEGHRSKLFLG
jgi:hypothetical protein